MLFGRTRWPLVSEIYEILQCAFTLKALIKVFIKPREPSFVVTPKGKV
jgi:cellulose synthase (UDP-forming)